MQNSIKTNSEEKLLLELPIEYKKTLNFYKNARYPKSSDFTIEDALCEIIDMYIEKILCLGVIRMEETLNEL
jgi:hypothetical protein